MRKRMKKKLRSCALCKPNKTCGGCRWTPREMDKIKRSEREIMDALRAVA